jgi:hypothetical protein
MVVGDDVGETGCGGTLGAEVDLDGAFGSWTRAVGDALGSDDSGDENGASVDALRLTRKIRLLSRSAI